MARAALPELKKYMDKRVKLQLNANRKVEGVLRGFDAFMNVVLDEAVEVCAKDIRRHIGISMIRGNTILMLETIENIPV